MNKFVIVSVVSSMIVACASSQSQTTTPTPAVAETTTVVVKDTITPPGATSEPVSADSCPNDMLLVSGKFCPKVKQGACLEHKGPKWAPCSKYAPSTCEVNTVEKSFCIDKEEEHDASGKPLGDMTFGQCEAVCKKQNKRLCREQEWTFACEGEDMLAFPYGNEYKPGACNANRTYKELMCGGHQPGRKSPTDLLCDLRANVSEYPECVSPFGVHNMVGDVDEWVRTPKYYKSPKVQFESGMKGGHFGAGRHRCEPTTYGHGAGYSQISSGCRCCEDEE